MNNERDTAAQPYVPPFVRRLMKNASEEDIQQAAENLRAYLKLVYGVFIEREAREARLARDLPADEHGSLIGLS